MINPRHVKSGRYALSTLLTHPCYGTVIFSQSNLIFTFVLKMRMSPKTNLRLYDRKSWIGTKNW